ncbi:2OG-Fe(II) oxygenase [Halobacteriovorax sp.]|uniref:2OG-Fe(II) oxygenase n=1 Tax=Halobacteriovorax sp. TaxID=2020862 RepID=UPI003565B10F
MTTIDKAILPPKSELLERGFVKLHLEFPEDFRDAVTNCNWEKVDALIFDYLKPKNILGHLISSYQQFNYTEHIIAIRDALTDEDGIWHDDGSRDIAFTWSLNDDCTLEGGELLFRKKGLNDHHSITPPKAETLIIFLTGKFGFEHKVNKVIKGKRKTIAGWCSIEKPNWL